MRDRSQLYIDGAWVAPQGQGVAEVQNPATEDCVGRVPLGGEGDVNRAVDAARRAFPAWSQTPSHVRAGYIRALAEQLKNRADEM
ncbi:aldehyde dehydrogenase family protein, partial [Pseudomonas nitroreducens]